MKQRRIKIISCALGFMMLFLLVGILVFREKESHEQPDWMGGGTEIQLMNTNDSEEERAQLIKQYEEEMADRALDLVDWTGREEEREQYRKELLQQ